jgi:hypothetical protein
LENNKHIVSIACAGFPDYTDTHEQYTFPTSRNSYILSLLPTEPPTEEVAIGEATRLPPTSDTFKENKHFLDILNSVLKQYANQDPSVQSQAQAFASNAGALFGQGGGSLFSQPRRRGQARSNAEGGGGGASHQGGAGGGGHGGYVHVSDTRNPPDFGRIAWPEDIFGSVEVDGQGKIVDDGNYQPSGTYRIVTREGM